jgi:hypothetical protein
VERVLSHWPEETEEKIQLISGTSFEAFVRCDTWKNVVDCLEKMTDIAEKEKETLYSETNK